MKKSITALIGLALSVSALAECELMEANGTAMLVCFGQEQLTPESHSAETATQGTIGKDEEDVKRWILEKPQKPVVLSDENPH